MSSLPRAIPLLDVESNDELNARIARSAGQRDTIIRRLRHNQEALHVLHGFPGPLYPISCTGNSRTGKSTFVRNLIVFLYWISGQKSHEELRQIAEDVKTFRVCGGSDPVTLGVEFWSEPIPRVGGGYYLVIDTEGTDQGSNALTAQLTAVSTLMSSVVLHVVRGYVNTDTLGRLATVSQQLSFNVPLDDAAAYEAASNDLVGALFLISQGMRWSNDLVYNNLLSDGGEAFDPFDDETKFKLTEMLDDKFAPHQDGHDDHREAIRGLFRTMHYSMTADADANSPEELLINDPIALLNDTERVPFAVSTKGTMQRIVECANPHSAENGEALVALLRSALPGINSQELDMGNIVLIAQSHRVPTLVKSISRDHAEPILQDCQCVTTISDAIAAARDTAGAILDQKAAERQFVPQVIDQAHNLLTAEINRSASVRRTDLQEAMLEKLQSDQVALTNNVNATAEQHAALKTRLQQIAHDHDAAVSDAKRAQSRIQQLSSQLSQAQSDLDDARRRASKNRCVAM